MTTLALVGMGHMGAVFAASFADLGHTVRCWDPSEKVLDSLRAHLAPVREPSLDDLLLQNNERLSYYSSLEMAVKDADIVWLTKDTPIRDNGVADIDSVRSVAFQALCSMSGDALFVSSSQLPVGTIAGVFDEWQVKTRNTRSADKWVEFAIVPENLRLGSALQCFDNERWVIGAKRALDHARVAEVFTNGAGQDYVFCTPAEAEMAKHFRNAWLAMNVAFGNELASICAKVGADAAVVARAAKADKRIGGAPCLPGGAYAGGHLSRDMNYLQKIAAQNDAPAYVLSAVEVSNRHHSLWTYRTLLKALNGDLRGKTIAVLGVAFKSGTADTTDSPAFALGDLLAGHGATIRWYDPLVPDCERDVLAACKDAAAVVVFQKALPDNSLTPEALYRVAGNTVVVDPNGHYRDVLDDHEYYAVGLPEYT